MHMLHFYTRNFSIVLGYKAVYHVMYATHATFYLKNTVSG